MNDKEFAVKILKCTYSQWKQVLKGRRNLGLQRAKLAAQIIETDVETWRDPEFTDDRKRAWKEFNA